ncbi:MAG: hypothetical protein UT58_C0004G0003 [Microgenomates group bacterium GW2011_GWC1_39_7b]|uniref:Cell division protein FtsL n=3 Tax=Candidatus Woeseibacteriota TaxID=1752722 RepID=A0A0G0LUT0_9BACT|nr:MAG: hypothetical protein UT17_C0004G0103 [Candidatus Woesebacteria bacterium GW2011_GWB1_39_10]KKR26860.1 MAG: hypothetical protein UT58_C0004G0003 [Microgenomates group bacterium GW2011_GWC1_39_7b]KKR74364.1 MAG: hypothetical protein UU16_C0001G0015 [Candidatus Woesebacteria bacterium GW2011_GWA2_40_7]KKS90747.1 MAG: hypothetical protein UV66_C0001G0104 [Candidatus Woesebacteria bacterium GW2011_GWA1_43_12]
MIGMIGKIHKKQVKKGVPFKNYFLAGFCGVLAIGSIAMTIETATSGMEIASLEKIENKLVEDRRDIEEMLVKTLSSRELQQKSKELGFTKPENLVYISQILPVAKLP